MRSESLTPLWCGEHLLSGATDRGGGGGGGKGDKAQGRESRFKVEIAEPLKRKCPRRSEQQPLPPARSLALRPPELSRGGCPRQDSDLQTGWEK